MHKVTGATDLGGGTLAVVGMIKPPQKGWTSPIDPRSGDDAGTRLYNLKESIPIIGKDPNLASNRATVGAGLLIAGGGRVLRWLVRAPVVKLGSHRVRLWGAGSGR